MKNIISTIAAVLALSAPTTASAQAININLDKKVIMADSLSLPTTTSVQSVLNILPELLQRPDQMTFSNYDVMLEDISVGNTSDIALLCLDLGDIQRIEIIESPVASYKHNGVGGTIKIFLRNKGREEDKDTWGSACFNLNKPIGVAPQFFIGKKIDNLTMRGILLSDIYNGTNDRETATFGDGRPKVSVNNETSRFRSQMAGFFGEYKPSAKHQFNVCLSESYLYSSKGNTPDYDLEMKSTSKKKATNLHALLKYIYRYGRAQFLVQSVYEYKPSTTTSLMPSVIDTENDSRSNNSYNKVDISSPLLPASSPLFLKLGVGSQFNFLKTSEDITFRPLAYVGSEEEYVSPVLKTTYIQPYANLEARWQQLVMKLSGEYQCYKYNISRIEAEHDIHANHLTAKLITEWHLAPAHCLRFILDRKLTRPGADVIYPVRYYSIDNKQYVEGNPDLNPTMFHEFNLGYTSNYQWGEHRLQGDLNASYSKVDDIISMVERGGAAEEGKIGVLQSYKTFENNGKTDLYSCNLMALYQYRAFALSLTANIYFDNKEVAGVSDHYKYWNISINPHFNLENGWYGSASVTYNSKVFTANSKLSGITSTRINVGKSWGSLSLYYYNQFSLSGRACDTTMLPDGLTRETYYSMLPNYTGIGLKYHF